jgi:hypothetical protein
VLAPVPLAVHDGSAACATEAPQHTIIAVAIPANSVRIPVIGDRL